MNHEYILPTDEEEATINAGIAADPDTREVSSEEFKKMRRRGRPLGSGKKEQTTIRLDADIMAKFKQMGEGWQTRINHALREWLEAHQIV